jgi:dolichyl-phosphate beta-glucosyltransferase
MKLVKKPSLSVIVPVYNETRRLYHLDQIFDFFKKEKEEIEIIIVNDGSTDKTLSELKKYQKKNRLEIVSYSRNRGKGFAIKTGMLAAGGQYRLFMDLDLSTPLDQWSKFQPHLKEADILIGSRKTKGAELLARQPWWRETLGKGFTLLSQLALNVWASDFTCGFKCFSEKAAIKIFSQATIERWGFDSEVLFLAKKYRLSVKEIPVAWKNDMQTKVKFPQDLVRSLSDLLAIRTREILGKY